jgi:serine/threonine-protein kinase
LDRLGLKGRRQEEQSDAATAGTVTATSPSAGQFVEKGTAVTLIVAVPVGIAVPSVGGEPVAEAVAALARVGLKWQREDQPSEAVTAGKIVSSSPAAGQMIGKGATVTLVVAVPVRIGVPRVVGQPLTNAVAALGRAGLKAQRQDETSDKVRAGRVISTAPPAGQLVDKGTTVVVLVAKAPARARPPPAVERPAPETTAVRQEPPVQQPEPGPATTGTGPARPWTPEPPPPNSTGNYGGWPQFRMQVGPVTLWPSNPAPSPPPSGAGSYGWQPPSDPVGDSYDRAHKQLGGGR